MYALRQDMMSECGEFHACGLSEFSLHSVSVRWCCCSELLVVAADCRDDAGRESVAATNSILLSLVTDRLKAVHDMELSLCEHDMSHIVKLLCTRLSSDYVLPPCVPVRFRCYVRILTASHLVLTVVPAAYADMVAVMSMLDSAADDTVKLTPDNKKDEFVADVVNCDGISTDQDVDVPRDIGEAYVDPNIGIIQANAEVTQSAAGVVSDVAVRLPVFVFDCLLNLVSDQLVHQSTNVRPADIVEDFTYQVTTAESQNI